jgi:hypothetical protein
VPYQRGRSWTPFVLPNAAYSSPLTRSLIRRPALFLLLLALIHELRRRGNLRSSFVQRGAECTPDSQKFCYPSLVGGPPCNTVERFKDLFLIHGWSSLFTNFAKMDFSEVRGSKQRCSGGAIGFCKGKHTSARPLSALPRIFSSEELLQAVATCYGAGDREIPQTGAPTKTKSRRTPTLLLAPRGVGISRLPDPPTTARRLSRSSAAVGVTVQT